MHIAQDIPDSLAHKIADSQDIHLNLVILAICRETFNHSFLQLIVMMYRLRGLNTRMICKCRLKRILSPDIPAG
jgi:hypothetical protein